MPYLYLRIAPVRTSSILSSGAVPHSKGISVSYKSISNPSASSYGSPLSLPLSLSGLIHFYWTSFPLNPRMELDCSLRSVA